MLTGICTPALRLFILVSLTILPTTVCAAPADMARLKAEYDCQDKAAEFTKNMGKPGDTTLYQEHYSQCMKLAIPDTTANISTKAPRSDESTCKDDEYRFTFTNTTKETVWLGVWDPDNPGGAGIPAPSHWPNWQLDPGSSNNWCARLHFNGRFMVRARCNTTTGICEEGNCCTDPAQCGSMKCNTGVQPTSLVEFNFDSNFNPQNPKGVTWYDVSYVDGYNFSLAITTNDKNCSALGGGVLPDCPWPTINGVCLAPYLQYQIDNPWWSFEQGYYSLAAKCAYQAPKDPKEIKEICGCGNQCTPAQKAIKILDKCENSYQTEAHPLTGQVITLQSRGCSPFNKDKYADDPNYAQKQIVCNPLDPNADTTKCGPWPTSPRDYTSYVSSLSSHAKKSYAWQYHDEDSLTSCPSVPGKQAFTVTIGPRPENKLKGNAFAPEFGPDPSLAGYITVDGGTPQQFMRGYKLRRVLKQGSKVTITTQCPSDKLTSLICTATYDTQKGLIPDVNDDCTSTLSGINWNDPKGNNPQTFNFGKPDPLVCKPPNTVGTKFQVTPADNTTGSMVITAPDAAKKTVPFAKTNQPFYLYLDAGYKLTINNECSSTDQASCNATYDKAKGLVQDPNNDATCATSSGIQWDTGTNRMLSFGAPVPAACKPKDKNLATFMVYGGDDFTGKISINDNLETPFKGTFPLHLHDTDRLKMVIDCSGGKTLSCKTTYSIPTGLLTLDAGQSKCNAASGVLGWGKEKNALRPGRPAADQCD